MQISVRDLLGIIAFSAVVAACASQAGFTNQLFWIVFTWMMVMCGLFVITVRSSSNRSVAALVPFPFVVICLCPGLMMSLSTLVSGTMLFLLGLCFLRFTPSNRTLFATTGFCASVGLFAGVYPVTTGLAQLEALRDEFPPQTLAIRVAYEHHHADQPPPQLSDQVARSLARSDVRSIQRSRNLMLKQIHDREYEKFVRANGFGVGRMRRPSAVYLRLPPLQSILPGQTTKEQHGDRNQWTAFYADSSVDSMEDFHRVAKSDFLDPVSFGAQLEPSREFVGFTEHAFHYDPMSLVKFPQRWELDWLKLVSLLKFDEPRVYEIDALPRMDQLSAEQAPTRPLDDFESQALPQLATELDLVVESNGNDHRMLGSLRAANTCLECHLVPRGTLLGAFSYQLRLIPDDDLTR